MNEISEFKLKPQIHDEFNILPIDWIDFPVRFFFTVSFHESDRTVLKLD